MSLDHQDQNNYLVLDNSVEGANESHDVNVEEDEGGPDGVHEFLGGILAGLQRLSPEMREMAKELIRAMLDRYLWAELNGLPPPPPPALPRYSPHG